jgi:geranylgeranyl diphosphate synthase type I
LATSISYEKTIQEMLFEIENQLKSSIDFSLSPINNELSAMIRYHMGWDSRKKEQGGKRIRPLLTLLVFGLFDDDWKRVLPAAASIELLHNFSLIHDDIQDESPLRHNQPTLWKIHGISQAINAGDALFAAALYELSRCVGTLPISVCMEINHLLLKTCIELTSGQYFDLSFEQMKAVDLPAYQAMISGKTAALMKASTMTGAICSMTSESNIALMSEFGRNLGLAFQIMDDYLGIWGNPGIIGKSNTSDLVSRKKTYPVIAGLHKSAEFSKLWSMDSSGKLDTEPFRSALEKANIEKDTLQLVKHYMDKAYAQLDLLSVDTNNRYFAILHHLCEKLISRES